jgi:P-type E1-E2 ATPase
MLQNSTSILIHFQRRYRQDVKNNTTKVSVLRNGAFQIVNWQDLQVGEIVRIERDHQFPSDLVFLSSSNQDGLCFIETANLDGFVYGNNNSDFL